MESRVRKPDFVHLPLPISIPRSTNISTPNRSSYRSSSIDQRATLFQGTRLGVGVDPAQAHSLRIITSPVARKSMAKRDSRPARYVYRGHSFRPGSCSPRTSPTVLCCQEFQLKWCRCPGTRPGRVHFALLCNTFAPWLLVGRIRSSCRTMSTLLHVIGLVRAPLVFQSRGPQRDRPPADCSYPGLAWHMGPWSNGTFDVPVT